MIDNKQTPFKKALRQARYVILGTISVAVLYNTFASTRIPWLAEPKVAEGGLATRVDFFGADSATPTIPADTIRAQDTTITSTPDTTRTVELDSAQRHALDSLRTLHLEEKRIAAIRADSIRKAVIKERSIDTNAGKSKDPSKSSGDDASDKPKDLNDADIVKEAFEKKAALFIDARPASDYAKGHIPGAINIYGEDGFQQYIPVLMRYPRETKIIVYCGGGLCELSHETAKNISTMKWFSKVFVFTGGTKVWIDKGYPMTTANDK